jgi:Mn-dependent DtxR family transcriptional regulator
LTNGPLTPAQIREAASAHGMSPNAMSGVLHRGKRDGLIRINGDGGYHLTAKGAKVEEVANG